MSNKALLNLFTLSGKCFVVTGGSSGIGRAMAGFLVEAGASVILVARREDVLIQAVDQISLAGNEAVYVVADLCNREQLAAVANQCKSNSDSGVIDGVINAAGITLRESAEQISHDSWDLTLNLNLSIPFFFSREFIPEMRKQGYGRVINIASLQSIRKCPG